MNRFLKILWYAIVALASIFVIILVALFVLLSVKANSCGEDSDSVMFARGLSQDRLSKLYYDVERFSLDSNTPYFGLNRDESGLFPEPFSDIEAELVRPKQENIMLNGCFDHYVFLRFHGFESNKEYYPKRQIVLSWGEHDNAGSEVIWSEQ
ncbi:hypothetical protein [Pleionea litopenaei]|uniref:Uncharacterized protein n=1 Tax=Pleionea litopenaei TaxID=3070815 RepID=A0AA51RT65_9GAMM|nr:hypothetical protein [Pleionea sp. HL-JVS1]WMS87135.1 hypothetical protein Q9312_18165 [Pleionea sp. HL-JVS1]